MWPYTEITREDFERIKDHIEEIMVAHGAVPIDVDLPYEQGSTSYSEDQIVEWKSNRKVYKFKDLYYRIDEVCFKKPSIVAEIGDYDELMKNIMEDADPFPYDLTDQEFEDEVSYFLGEKPYPQT